MRAQGEVPPGCFLIDGDYHHSHEAIPDARDFLVINDDQAVHSSLTVSQVSK